LIAAAWGDDRLIGGDRAERLLGYEGNDTVIGRTR